VQSLEWRQTRDDTVQTAIVIGCQSKYVSATSQLGQDFLSSCRVAPVLGPSKVVEQILEAALAIRDIIEHLCNDGTPAQNFPFLARPQPPGLVQPLLPRKRSLEANKDLWFRQPAAMSSADVGINGCCGWLAVEEGTDDIEEDSTNRGRDHGRTSIITSPEEFWREP